MIVVGFCGYLWILGKLCGFCEELFAGFTGVLFSVFNFWLLFLYFGGILVLFWISRCLGLVYTEFCCLWVAGMFVIGF